jgi:hypothetical protein
MNLALLNIEVARKEEHVHCIEMSRNVWQKKSPSTKIIALKIEAVRFSEMYERAII